MSEDQIGDFDFSETMVKLFLERKLRDLKIKLTGSHTQDPRDPRDAKQSDGSWLSPMSESSMGISGIA